jgi:uncharacterized protein YeaO (DUF488 family)
MVKIFTSKIGYKLSDGMDITVKSGDLDFAPTWDMVSGSKSGKMTKEEYTRRYTELMGLSYRNMKASWERLLSSDRVTLLCYCNKGKFCHRKLLAELLHINFPEAEYVGELDSDGNLVQQYAGGR